MREEKFLKLFRKQLRTYIDNYSMEMWNWNPEQEKVCAIKLLKDGKYPFWFMDTWSCRRASRCFERKKDEPHLMEKMIAIVEETEFSGWGHIRFPRLTKPKQEK